MDLTTSAEPNVAPAETWTSGHRTPYGLAFAPDGRLWEVEHGPRGGDELNLIEPGKNHAGLGVGKRQWRRKTLNRITFDGKGGATPAERWDVGHRIRDVEVGPDGAVWMLEDANPGGLFRVTPK